MAKYLFQASYVGEGVKGLLKEGGSKRQESVAKAIKGLGGSLEAFYYAFGDYDLYGIAEIPDNVSTAAFSLLVNSCGAAKVKTVVLLTPEEMDKASKMNIDYRPPGR